jgi:hypothetical protein
VTLIKIDETQARFSRSTQSVPDPTLIDRQYEGRVGKTPVKIGDVKPFLNNWDRCNI